MPNPGLSVTKDSANRSSCCIQTPTLLPHTYESQPIRLSVTKDSANRSSCCIQTPTLLPHTYRSQPIRLSVTKDSTNGSSFCKQTPSNLGCPQISLRSKTEAKHSETFFREIAKLTPSFACFASKRKRNFRMQNEINWKRNHAKRNKKSETKQIKSRIMQNLY